MELKKDQVIVHLTSHGESALVTDEWDAGNSFANLVKAPITGINKIGLLYATIPRMM